MSIYSFESIRTEIIYIFVQDDPTEVFTGGNLGEKKNCEGCYLITAQMKKKFINTPRDDILDNVLEVL